MKHFLLVASIGFVAGFVVSACGTPVPVAACSSANCDGCCDSTDKCRTGTAESACGAAGNACDVCVSSQTCQAGKCALPAASDGGTGGGTGTGGGAGGGSGGGTGTGGGAGGGTAGGTGTGGGAGGGTAGGTGGGVSGDAGCAPVAVTCSDQAIQSLDLKTTVNAAAMTTVTEDGGFKTTIDATAGGSAPTMSYVYGKFTDTGMTKVSVADEASLTSMDWDIAFRRFVIRLNSGSSGPSCVKAAAPPLGTSYDTLTAPDAGYVSDDFEGPPPTCTFKDDGSGLTTSPSTALANLNASFYDYAVCVAMTGQVFVIQTRSGRHVKLLVTNYYPSDAAQTACNAGNPTPGTIGGTVKVRWSFLD